MHVKTNLEHPPHWQSLSLVGLSRCCLLSLNPSPLFMKIKYTYI